MIFVSKIPKHAIKKFHKFYFLYFSIFLVFKIKNLPASYDVLNDRLTCKAQKENLSTGITVYTSS